MLVAVLLPRDKLQLDTSWAKKEAGKFKIDDHNKRDYYDAMVELENTKFQNHTQRSDWERMAYCISFKTTYVTVLINLCVNHAICLKYVSRV